MFGNRYPRSTRMESVPRAGVLRVLFVVDTTGGVEPNSIKILTTISDGLAKDLRETLRSWRFQPAIRKGQKVRQVEDATFDFSIMADPVKAELQQLQPTRPWPRRP